MKTSNKLLERLWLAGGALLLSALSGGCGAESEKLGTGSLSVLLASEELIVDGLRPGDDAENIGDGWSVDYEKYLVTVGNVELYLATDHEVERSAPETHVVDLTQVSASGLSLWELDNLKAERWEFHYETPEATGKSVRHESVTQSDFDAMVSHHWTYLIAGTLSQGKGQSCPPEALVEADSRSPNGEMSGKNPCYDAPSLRFSIGAEAVSRFGPCEIDGVPGLAIPSGGTQTVAATIHGDHLFFNGFPEGNESGVQRLAQWLADCDLDLDGIVTVAELEAISPSALPELDSRYQLGGSPITPLDNMYDYVRSQLKTQGHYQGEGECPLGTSK